MSRKKKLTDDEARAHNRERMKRWRQSLSPEDRERMRVANLERVRKRYHSTPKAVMKARHREQWLRYGKPKTSRRQWSEEANARLRQCYPTYSRAELQRMFRRSWSQIAGHAADLGVKRRLYIPTKDRVIANDPLVQALVDRRISAGITISALAQKIGVENSRVSCWELGRHPPELKFLRWWAEALGMKIALTETSAPIVKLKVSMPWLERLQFDEATGSATIDGHSSKHLTVTERKLLRSLSIAVRSKEQIHAKLYGDDVDDAPKLKIIDVMVCKLRQKLKYTPIAIETAWAEGYYLAYRPIKTNVQGAA